MTSFDAVWRRIVASEGQVFHQKRGKEFRYEVIGNSVRLSTTNRKISRGTFEQAYERVPAEMTTTFQDMNAPSYRFGILMDRSISKGDW